MIVGPTIQCSNQGDIWNLTGIINHCRVQLEWCIIIMLSCWAYRNESSHNHVRLAETFTRSIHLSAKKSWMSVLLYAVKCTTVHACICVYSVRIPVYMYMFRVYRRNKVTRVLSRGRSSVRLVPRWSSPLIHFQRTQCMPLLSDAIDL